MKGIRFFTALFTIAVFVIPAFALDIDLSGRYIVEHYSNSNETLSTDDARNSYSSMELVLKPILTINDNIKLTTEFTTLQDHVWGTDSQPRFQQDNPFLPTIDSGNNIDWKTAYLTLKTSVGGFLIGRGIEKRWGTGLGDSTGSHGSNSKHKDGILWVVPVGNFISGLGWQHIKEGDKDLPVTDADFDKTYLFSAYKQEDWHAGLLLARYDHKNFIISEQLRKFQIGYSKFQQSISDYRLASAIFGFAYRVSEHMEEKGYYDKLGLSDQAKDYGYSSVTRWELETAGSQIESASGGTIPMNDLNQLMIDADIAQARATSYGANIKNGPERSILALWVLDPYLIGKFGSFRVETELLYGWGKVDLNASKFSSDSSKMIDVVDVEALACTLGVWRDLGNFTLGVGSTYVQGDNGSYDDGKFSGIGYLEPSIDFERGFLLNSDISRIGLDFGGVDCNGIPLGNLSSGPLSVAGTSGYKMFWIETEYDISEKLNLGILCITSHADDPPEGWGNNHGIECDFVLKWNIMDNLTFDATLAYLDAGSFWKAGRTDSNLNDITALHGRLTLEF